MCAPQILQPSSPHNSKESVKLDYRFLSVSLTQLHGGIGACNSSMKMNSDNNIKLQSHMSVQWISSELKAPLRLGRPGLGMNKRIFESCS